MCIYTHNVIKYTDCLSFTFLWGFYLLRFFISVGWLVGNVLESCNKTAAICLCMASQSATQRREGAKWMNETSELKKKKKNSTTTTNWAAILEFHFFSRCQYLIGLCTSTLYIYLILHTRNTRVNTMSSVHSNKLLLLILMMMIFIFMVAVS